MLGEGRFGKVVLTKKNDNEVAMKIVSVVDVQGAFDNEFYALTHLKKVKKEKNYLCEFMDFGFRDEVGFVTMKKYDSDLYDYAFNNKSKMSEKQIKKIFLCICKGVQILHKRGLAHLDLKPENILMDIKKEKPFIGDFGSAWVEKKGKKKRTRSLECLNSVPHIGNRGTAAYSSPEMKKTPDSYDPYRSDIYSLGVLLHVLLLGYYPPNFELREEKNVTLEYLHDENISSECCELLKLLLEINPENRCSIGRILKNPWFLTSRCARFAQGRRMSNSV